MGAGSTHVSRTSTSLRSSWKWTAPTNWCSNTRLPRSSPRARSRTISRHTIPNLTPFPRVVLIVLDSVGCGELPDAGLYGDEGSDTLGNIAPQVQLRVPRLRARGLGRVARLGGRDTQPAEGAYGRMAEASAGKDSVTGHWEMMGLIQGRPFPTFPQGFPASVVAEFESRIGRGILGNVVASGAWDALRPGARDKRAREAII